jgi:hypothetical protein
MCRTTTRQKQQAQQSQTWLTIHHYITLQMLSVQRNICISANLIFFHHKKQDIPDEICDVLWSYTQILMRQHSRVNITKFAETVDTFYSNQKVMWLIREITISDLKLVLQDSGIQHSAVQLTRIKVSEKSLMPLSLQGSRNSRLHENICISLPNYRAMSCQSTRDLLLTLWHEDRLSPSSPDFSCHYNSTNATYQYFIPLPLMQHNLRN